MADDTTDPTDPVAPTPPPALAAYIVDGIDRQDVEALAAIEEYARERRAYLAAQTAREPDEDELAGDDEELVDVEDGDDADGGTVVIKRVPCGNDCGGCPHGPYRYVVRRTGDGLNWEYKGPADPDG